MEESSSEMQLKTSNMTKSESSGLNDAERFNRERSLLLLSALFYLYGDKWSQSPDWKKVAETIKEKKIPVYGDDFTAELCNQQYKRLMEKGVEIDKRGGERTTLKPPDLLTESEKRLWILASISSDIVRSCREMEGNMREEYKFQLSVIDRIASGSAGFTTEELEKQLEESDSDPGEETEYEDEYEADEAETTAAELWQLELLQKIVGLQDVLLLVKYCNDAADYAVQNYPADSSQSKCQESETLKAEETPANKTQESQDRTSEAVQLTPVERSPQKSSSKPSTRSNSRDSTPADCAKDSLDSESSTTTHIVSSDKGSEPTRVHSPSPAPVATSAGTPTSAKTNGDGDGITVVVTESEGNKTPLNSDISTNQDSLVTEGKLDTERKDDNNDEECKKTTPEEIVEQSKLEDVLYNDIVTDTQKENNGTDQGESVTPKEVETGTKGKLLSRKSVLSSRPASKRTSSRLASPEPNENTQSEDEKQKRTRGRHSSNSDANQPVLRSRRVGTPPTAVPVPDKDPAKNSPANAKPDPFALDEEEETFETPRTTPESLDIRTDFDNDQEIDRPKLKTYSVKPPSPLSQVDPKIFDEFIDDEDDPELAMIDNNVQQKSKGDKTTSSPAKTPGRKARTVSSENISENNEDNVQNKRVTRRVGHSEENDESGEQTGQPNDENAKGKRLTRSSLKIHDAANDDGGESVDRSSRTGSEKAPSESSFGGKERKVRQGKMVISRGRKLFDERNRSFGEGDGEETPEGKRVTRARAKTSSFSEKSKKPSVGDAEGASESDPTPTRSTRSRVSTSISTTVPEPSVSLQPISDDDDSNKAFRKTAFTLLDKISSHEAGSTFQKYMEDPDQIVKSGIEFQDIKQDIENGKIKSIVTLQRILSVVALNAVFAHSTSQQVREASQNFIKMVKGVLEDSKSQRGSSSNKIDNNSDVEVEPIETQDDSRSEIIPKLPPGSGGRRKRRRSASETSEDVFSGEHKRRVTRTSMTSSAQPPASRKPKHPISPDIVAHNRVRH